MLRCLLHISVQQSLKLPALGCLSKLQPQVVDEAYLHVHSTQFFVKANKVCISALACKNLYVVLGAVEHTPTLKFFWIAPPNEVYSQHSLATWGDQWLEYNCVGAVLILILIFKRFSVLSLLAYGAFTIGQINRSCTLLLHRTFAIQVGKSRKLVILVPNRLLGMSVAIVCRFLACRKRERGVYYAQDRFSAPQGTFSRTQLFR